MSRAKTFPGGPGIRHIPVGGIRRVEGRAKGEKATRYEVAVSSETPVERSFYGVLWREVLGHGSDEVDLARFQSKRAAVLEEHEGPPVGVIESARVDSDRVLRAVIRFSNSGRGQEVEQDVREEVRQNISVGYLPKKARLVEEDDERGDLWRITSWEAVELSVVGVPADPSVGVNRDLSGGTYPPVETEEGDIVKKVREGSRIIEVADDDPRPAVRDARAEAVEISEMAAANGLSHRAAEWIRDGLHPDAVGRLTLEAKATRGTSAPAAESADLLDGLSGRDRKSYSYARALLVACGDEHGGLEAEVDQALGKLYPARRSGERSILVPMRLGRDSGGWARRGALDTKTPTGGSELVFDMPCEFIDLYPNAAMVIRAGARMVTGLTGNIGIVKKTAAATAHWVGENPGADVTESEVATGLVLSSPKTLMATTAYSRQFIVQAPSSGVDGENMVRADLAETHALALDLAALYGSGVSAEPLGLYSHPDVLKDTGIGVPAWEDFTTAIGKIGDANAPTDRLAWITHPLLAAKLLATLIASAAGSTMVWQGMLTNGSIAGYPAFATGQARKDLGAGAEVGLVLGRWSELAIMSWAAFEVIVDPYAKKKQGLIECTSYQLADIVIRQPSAFWRGEGVTLS